MTAKPRRADGDLFPSDSAPDTASPGGAPFAFPWRQEFRVGDRVRPAGPHRGDPNVPQGVVVKVTKFGKGQCLLIEGATSYFLSGFFELEPSA